MGRYGYFEKAYQIASILNSEDMMEDIYQQALLQGYPTIAFAALPKCSKLFQSRIQRINTFTSQCEEILDKKFGKDRLNPKSIIPIEKQNALTNTEKQRFGAFNETHGSLQKALQFYKELDDHARLSSLMQQLNLNDQKLI